MTAVLTGCLPGDPGFSVSVKNECSHKVDYLLQAGERPPTRMTPQLADLVESLPAKEGISWSMLGSPSGGFLQVVVGDRLGPIQHFTKSRSATEVRVAIDGEMCELTGGG